MKKLIILFVLLTAFLSTNSFSQQTQTLSFEGDNIALLSEVMGVLSFENEKLTVKFMPPAGHIKTKVNLKKDDDILFINGKRIKSLDIYNQVYNSIKIGDEIKLGVKRGDERFITTLNKIDPKDAGGPGMKVMTMTVDDPEKIDSLKKAGNVMMKKEVKK